MSDAFLTLAQAPGGLTCFLVPRWTPDGERNAIRLMRLKDKLGNRANASAEIEYAGAFALALGEPGDGVRTIIEMVHHTRLDTAMAPAGLMRAALSEALWWCERAAGLRAAADRAAADGERAGRPRARGRERAGARAAGGAGLRRRRTAPSPGWRWRWRSSSTTSAARGTIYEAMECLGGMGYVEEGPMPLLYREAPLNSIWEGSGNVICLDVLRTLAKDAAARGRLEAELAAARGRSPALRPRGWTISPPPGPTQPPEAEARWFVERLATLLAASVLLREGAEPVAEAYVATRVAGEGGRVAGAWPARIDREGLIARAMPC